MKVLSIDPAKKTGFAIFDTKKNQLIDCGTWTIHKEKFTPSEVISRLNDINDGEIFSQTDLVLIEGQGGQLNSHNNGIIKGAILKEINCTQIEVFHPRTWQSFIKKELIELYSRGENLPIFEGKDTETKLISKIFASWFIKKEIKDDNIADAICIYYYWLRGL